MNKDIQPPERIFLITAIFFLFLICIVAVRNPDSIGTLAAGFFLIGVNFIVCWFFWKKSKSAISLVLFLYYVWDRKDKELVILDKHHHEGFNTPEVRAAQRVCFTLSGVVLLGWILLLWKSE
jgi:hypothetical protein